MSKLVPFNHKNEMESKPFTNMVDEFFDDAWFPFRSPHLEAFKLDVTEKEDGYTVEAEVPGAKKKDITLNLDAGRLTIGVAARDTVKGDKRTFLHRERRYSYMERSIYLQDAAVEKAEATLNHGELVITIPKVKSDKKTQKIKIQ